MSKLSYGTSVLDHRPHSLSPLESVLADAVEEETSNQDSNEKCKSANEHCCNAQSSICADGSRCSEGSWFITYRIRKKSVVDVLA